MARVLTPGDVYDVGAALAVYLPDTHPCHATAAHEPWLIVYPEGDTERTPEIRSGAKFLGRMPGFTEGTEQ